MVAEARTIPTIDLMKIRTDMGLSREKMARIVDVSSKTIERWEKSNALPQKRHVRNLMVRLQEIVDLGLTVYTPKGFELFMTTPMPVFDDRTALELIEINEEEGTRRVLGALAADYEGLGF